MVTASPPLNTVGGVEGTFASHEDVLWSPRLAWGFAATCVTLAVIVASEPRPPYSVVLRILVSAVPAVLWCVCAAIDRPPFAVRAVITFAAVTVLLLHPAQFDAAPFFLVLLIGDAVSESPKVAALLAVASGGLLVGLELAGRYEGSLI